MGTWFWLVFATLGHFVILKSSYQTLVKIATKKLNARRPQEDYTFEGHLARAREECSFTGLVNTTAAARNRTIQTIKEKASESRVKDFYREKEREKKRAREYYENVEKQSRRRVLEGGNGNRERGPNFAPRPFPPQPPPAPPFLRRSLFKRSPESNGRRRKASASFSQVSFADHNNCSSRCIFARMEMVNPSGFPDESLVTKSIDDKITNKKFRMVKTKKVASCFKKMEEVAFDDSCIFSARLFECLDLGESYLWSNNP